MIYIFYYQIGAKALVGSVLRMCLPISYIPLRRSCTIASKNLVVSVFAKGDQFELLLVTQPIANDSISYICFLAIVHIVDTARNYA